MLALNWHQWLRKWAWRYRNRRSKGGDQCTRKVGGIVCPTPVPRWWAITWPLLSLAITAVGVLLLLGAVTQ